MTKSPLSSYFCVFLHLLVTLILALNIAYIELKMTSFRQWPQRSRWPFKKKSNSTKNVHANKNCVTFVCVFRLSVLPLCP